ncbi:glycosyltransferase family 2 protein [Microbacterium sp.]|uniref:glycosyltransferase family 2 protein n=1 Tax=Microbacterium sp. TaxID=51671 RepID=UPI0037C8749F
MSDGPSVVVVIATYRRPHYVRECLEHLAVQTLRADRIVVVDASPDDETAAVVCDFPHVEYLRNDHGIGTLATSRAIGIAGAGEDVVAFIDDDAFARPDWLERLVAPYSEPDVAAVGGRTDNGRPEELDQGVGQIGLILPDGRLTGYFAADPGRRVDVDHMMGANMSARLSVVSELGGIRDYYPGTCLREDSDLPLRMRRRGWRVVYEPAAVVRHMAGDYAKGRRFDSRYRFYGARNHIVLLATVYGWRRALPWRYLRTAFTAMFNEIVDGLRAVKDPAREGLHAKIRGVGGGFRRAAIDFAGLTVGCAASLRRHDRAHTVTLPGPGVTRS